jgi:ribA/ribD-fused uncharacterized protein
MIDSFRGNYSFLSNFYLLPSPIRYCGIDYPRVENAYQAAKFLSRAGVNAGIREAFALMTAVEAKQKGGLNGPYTHLLRHDWEDVKVDVMRNLLKKKFEDKELRGKLLLTGQHELVEGNTWHDLWWGCCNCKRHHGEGENQLGKLLMDIRKQIREGAI